MQHGHLFKLWSRLYCWLFDFFFVPDFSSLSSIFRALLGFALHPTSPLLILHLLHLSLALLSNLPQKQLSPLFSLIFVGRICLTFITFLSKVITSVEQIRIMFLVFLFYSHLYKGIMRIYISYNLLINLVYTFK